MTDLSADIAALPDRSLLVLDDDAPLRTRLGRALEQRGFEIVLVGSVAEALAAVKSSPPAYAVLDMRLEDGTGLKVVEAVREAPATPLAPARRKALTIAFARLAAMRAMGVAATELGA